MSLRIACLALACTLLTAIDRPATAGGIHIRYGPDVPEQLAAKNVGYYEGIVTMEHRHPIAFAEEHPFYTRMFHDPGLLNKEMALWESHEQRFEYWHDCLWKVLDGYQHSHLGLHSSHAFPTGSSLKGFEGGGGTGGISGVGPGTNSGGLDWLGIHPGNDQGGGIAGGGGGGKGGEGGGGGIGIQSVPEPSSGLLMTLGLAVAAGWTAARRLRARARPAGAGGA